MQKYITSSLIISTYNWKEALELLLKCVVRQSLLPDEVIIADDGSKDDTKLLIDNAKKNFPTNLIHVWHKDDGFRKTIILNKAIAISKADYIIQVDGDCIMHKHFIKDHIHFAVKNAYLFGSRSRIKEDYLSELFKTKKIDFNMLSKGIKVRLKAFYAPFLSFFYYRKEVYEIPHKLRGCNMSFWKSDILSINGYDEDMIGWGREDSEIIARLVNNGIIGRRIRYRGLVFHIYHKEESRHNFNINDDILNDCIAKKTTWCDNGIDKYLN